MMVLLRGRKKHPQLCLTGSLQLDGAPSDYIPPAPRALPSIVEMILIVESHSLADNKAVPRQPPAEIQDIIPEEATAVTSPPVPEESTAATSLTDEPVDWCRLADARYRELFRLAQSDATIYIVASHLPADVLHDLKLFCLTKLNGVKFKLCLSDTFQKATICVTPLIINSDGMLVVQKRSFKVLRCAIEGVPIVSPSWIVKSKTVGKPALPCDDLVARSIPSKTDGLCADDWEYGLAKLAIFKQQGSLFMSGYSIVFGRDVSKEMKTELEILARAAGAAVSTRVATRNTLSRLCLSQDVSLVLVGAPPERCIDPMIKIVAPEWIFDVISCAGDPHNN